jgi:hypothetical protein
MKRIYDFMHFSFTEKESRQLKKTLCIKYLFKYGSDFTIHFRIVNKSKIFMQI